MRDLAATVRPHPRWARVTTLGGIALLVIGVLSACGSDEEDAAGGTGTALTVAIDAGLEPDARAAFDEAVARFEKSNPDVSVTAEEYTWEPATFATKLAGDSLPDVFTVPFTDGPGLIAREQIADISERVAALGYTEDLNPAVASAGQDSDGRLWAVPIAAYGQGLHYNRALFEEAGLDPDAPPTTWSQVRAAADQIAAETGQAGYAQMTQANTGGWILTTLVDALGARIDGPDGTTATIDTPQMREALEMIREMRWEDDSMGSNFLYDWAGINQDFAAGRIGMYISGGGNYGNLFTQNGMNPDEYGLTVLPIEGADAGVLGGGTLAAVRAGASPEQQDAAVAWIDFYYMAKLTDEKAAVEGAETTADQDLPVGAPELPIFDQATYDKQQTWIKPFVNVPLDQMTSYTDNVFDQPLLPEPRVATQDVYAALDPVVQTVLTEEDADVDALLADAQAAVESIIAENG